MTLRLLARCASPCGQIDAAIGCGDSVVVQEVLAEALSGAVDQSALGISLKHLQSYALKIDPGATQWAVEAGMLN